MKFVLLCVFLIDVHISIAQLKEIDSALIDNWPELTEEKISNNGQVVCYIRRSKEAEVGVIRKVNEKKEFSIPDVVEMEFANNSQFAIFLNKGDSLGFFNLTTNIIDYSPSIGSYKISNRDCIAYLAKDGHELKVTSLLKPVEYSIPNADDYLFTPMGSLLAYTTSDSGSTKKSLYLLDVDTGEQRFLISGISISELGFSLNSDRLLFIYSKLDSNPDNNELIQYDISSKHFESLFSKKVIGGDTICLVQDYYPEPFFYDELGTKVFFYTRVISSGDSQIKNKKVEIWAYTDKMLVSPSATNKMKNENVYLSVINIASDPSFYQLQQEDDEMPILPVDGSREVCAVISGKQQWEGIQSTENLPSLYLITSATGQRELIKEHISVIDAELKVSPKGRFVLWFDEESADWYSYNVLSREINCLTSSIHFDITRIQSRLSVSYGIAGWTSDGKSVFLYGKYDIWILDLEGKKNPICLTNYYGTRSKTQLRFVWENGITKGNILSDGPAFLLSGFKPDTKENGLFQLIYKDKIDVKKLRLQREFIYKPDGYYAASDESTLFIPVKAKGSDRYLLKIMRDDAFPNLYTTKDFKILDTITNYQPQQEYNWSKNELFRWNISAEELGKAIIYKPANFDPLKKYPAIFYIYEKATDNVNYFINPNYSNGTINIPYFVSRGYIVIFPDINYQLGFPCRSALETVGSCVKAVCRIPWINGQMLGLAGHSHGGWEVNYIVSHTRIFKCALSAAGLCNIVSRYTDFSPDVFGNPKYYSYYEKGQGRIGYSLWDRPSFYVDNSPIFNCKNVSTPLLVMHNKGDYAVPWTQSLSWFTALHRLGKKVWMLNYPLEGHTIIHKSNQIDFTKKLLEFFDYYLKEKAMPEWMQKD